ncbi:hypothetical protein MKX01_020092, partial [Papaver californicum]
CFPGQPTRLLLKNSTRQTKITSPSAIQRLQGRISLPTITLVIYASSCLLWQTSFLHCPGTTQNNPNSLPL